MLATADFFSFVVEDGRIYSVFPDFLIFTPMPKGVCLAELYKSNNSHKEEVTSLNSTFHVFFVIDYSQSNTMELLPGYNYIHNFLRTFCC